MIRTTTRETERSHWAHVYFPTLARHQPRVDPEDRLVAELETAGFQRVELHRFRYEDEGDGSFQALKYTPEAFLDSAVTGNLAVFQRMPPADVARGVEALRRDHRSGRLREVIEDHAPLVASYGDGVIVSAC